MSIQIILAILIAIVSPIITHYVKKVLLYISIKRKEKKILGSWHSAYQVGGDDWYSDEVELQVNLLGKIRIKGKTLREENYYWDANIQKINSDYLLGDWVSTLPHSNANGVFVLSISFHGNYLYGYWSGQTEIKTVIFGGWVMARERENIEKAKELLNKSDLNIYR